MEVGGLEFHRFYNSRGAAWTIPMGANWSHTYSRWFRIMAANEARAFRADGKQYIFRLVNGSWVPDADVQDRVVPITGGWKYTTAGDEVEIYDAEGNLTSITTRSGVTTNLLYSDGTATGPLGATIEGSSEPLPSGKLIAVEDFRGRRLSLTYNASWLISKMTSSRGEVFRYGYDSYSNLHTVTYPYLSGDPVPVRTYLYNESENISGAANLYFHLTGIIDENNARFATYQYQADGKAIATFHAGNVDKYTMSYGAFEVSPGSPIPTRTTTWTGPTSTTNNTYKVSNIQNVAQVSGTTQNCDGCGGASSEAYEFDASRNLQSKKDFNGNLTCYTNDASRNLETSRTEGLKGTCAQPVTTVGVTRKITTSWHPTLRVAKQIAEPLRITEYSFNGEPGVSCAPAGASAALVCAKTVKATTDASGADTHGHSGRVRHPGAPDDALGVSRHSSPGPGDPGREARDQGDGGSHRYLLRAPGSSGDAAPHHAAQR